MEPLTQRSSHRADGSLGVKLMGRLKPGVSIEQGQAELDVLNRPRIEEICDGQREFPLAAKARLEVEPAGAGFSVLRDNFAKPLQVLMAIVAMLLLIACPNVRPCSSPVGRRDSVKWPCASRSARRPLSGCFARADRIVAAVRGWQPHRSRPGIHWRRHAAADHDIRTSDRRIASAHRHPTAARRASCCSRPVSACSRRCSLGLRRRGPHGCPRRRRRCEKSAAPRRRNRASCSERVWWWRRWRCRWCC